MATKSNCVVLNILVNKWPMGLDALRQKQLVVHYLEWRHVVPLCMQTWWLSLNMVLVHPTWVFCEIALLIHCTSRALLDTAFKQVTICSEHLQIVFTTFKA